ncbi:MAG: RluA family pseudouridine synthase [Candidatus Omnitrophota bacterium]|nr:RluA family pseudouridine synthase [Candidatus Omnitrophota bacterium]
MEEKLLKIRVDAAHKGKRLDKFLAEEFSEEFSRSYLQKLLKEGKVLLNGGVPKGHHIIDTGERVEIIVPAPVESVIKAEKIPLDIVYEDKYLLVVNKPQGMVTHPAPGNYTGTLVNALLGRCRDLSGIGGVHKPGIVHRLDKGTSGLLVVAKTDEVHRKLSKQFKNKTTKRVYIAIVRGNVELDHGTIELPIGRSVRDRKKMAVKFDDERSKSATTHYKVIKRFGDFTILECVLGTGRTHQIRVHLSYIGHPILGDEKYGSKGKFKFPMLHAAKIGFTHPITKKFMEFSQEPPREMADVIKTGEL